MASEESELHYLIEKKVKEAFKENNAELLSSINGMMSKISAKPNSTISVLDAPKFKRKSNEEQFKVNSKVLGKLEEVESAIQSENLHSAHESLIEAKDLLKRRQKLVQLADSSELGWRVVTEYETNPIASDSEDERKIYKAEARASRKAKSDKSKKSRRNWPYRRQAETSTSSSSQLPVQGQRQRTGLCFLCGKAGHWKNECSQSTAQSNNKISSCFVEDCTSVSNVVETKNKSAEGSESLAVPVSSNEERSFSQLTNILDEKVIFCNDIRSSLVSSPVGRLKRHINKWLEVSDNRYILDVLEFGYKIPFKEIPQNTFLRNNKSARDNPEFVKAEIQNLLKKGVISEVSEKPHVINPLTVAFNRNGKPRLVLDCRHINPSLHMFKVKFEDIKVAEKLFELSSYVYTFDLKSAYHHIDIFPEHTTYLGFSWEENNQLKYYVYNSLPFGISIAGHIFTKTLKVLVKYWRSLGHRIIMFLDDGIGGHVHYEQALLSSNFVRQSLREFGFLLAEDKCIWTPSRMSNWLGHFLDFNRNRLFISTERIDRLEVTLQSVLFQVSKDKLDLIPVRFLASVVGQIISLQSVLGKLVSLRTRYIHKCILSRASWNACVKVSARAVDELRFWLGNARVLNREGRGLKERFTANFSLYTDASAVGYGGYVTAHEPRLIEREREQDLDIVCNVQSFTEIVCGIDGGFQVDPFVQHDLDCVKKAHPETIVDSPGSGSGHVKLPEVSLKAPGSEQQYETTPELGVDNFICKSINLILPEESSMFYPREKAVDTMYSGHEVRGSWTDQEMGKSSTWRELEAVRRVLLSNIRILNNKQILIYTDNKNVTHILNTGSYIEDLHRIAINIYDVCMSSKISFVTEWIPRRENIKADYLSRCLDCDDWSVSDTIFQYLNAIWGPYTVDRFACHYNSKCKRFNSRWWVPGTEAVNSFHQTWSGESNWLVPPPCCIMECINKLKAEKCTGIGIKHSLKRKFEQAGVDIDNGDYVIQRMATHILGSKADSTVAKYFQQVKAFKDFCAVKGFPCSPAHSIHVAMYLSFLIDSGKSDTVITAAFYGIKWFHNINDLIDPTENSIVKNMLECAKRFNSKPVKKKDVITSEHLIQLCNMFTDTTDVITLRDLTMILLSYAGFLRFNELSDLRCCDIFFKDDHLALFIRKSKTDVYRSGKEVLISKGESSACPVSMLQRYLSCANLTLGTEIYLFRPACRSNSQCFLLNKNKKLSYTRARECIVSKLKMVAPSLHLGTHSLRASGASAAANAEGVSDRCIKRHGRWKTDLAKDGYIDDSLEKKLFITRQLNL